MTNEPSHEETVGSGSYRLGFWGRVAPLISISSIAALERVSSHAHPWEFVTVLSSTVQLCVYSRRVLDRWISTGSGVTTRYSARALSTLARLRSRIFARSILPC